MISRHLYTPVLAGGYPRYPFEELAEVVCTGKTKTVRDFSDRKIRIGQKLLGFFELLIVDVILKSTSCLALDDPAELALADI